MLPAWVVPLVTFASAILGSTVTFSVQRWRYWTDRLAAAVDGLCSEINGAADKATSYWLTEGDTEEGRARVRLAEFELVGRQSRIQELIGALYIQDEKLVVADLDNLVIGLLDAMTGGDFRVAGRVPDPVRAAEVQTVAARLNGALRAGLNRRVQGLGLAGGAEPLEAAPAEIACKPLVV